MFTSHTPIEHLYAEIVAQPLTSTSSLEYSLDELNPDVEGSTTGDFWRAIKKNDLKRFGIFSIEKINRIRDSLWFTKDVGLLSQTPVSIEEYLSRISKNILSVSGNRLQPRLSLIFANEIGLHQSLPAANGRRYWRWLSYSMPPDLLLAAHPKYKANQFSLDILSSELDVQLREQGFSENHLHLGAALDFRIHWISIVTYIADSSCKEKDFYSAGAEFSEGTNLLAILLHGVICRYVLADYLKVFKGDISFEVYLEKICSVNGDKTYDMDTRLSVLETLSPTEKALLFNTITGLKEGKWSTLSEDVALLKYLYKQIIRCNPGYPAKNSLSDNIVELEQADPIYHLCPDMIPPQNGKNSYHANPFTISRLHSPEVSFISRSMTYLRTKQDFDIKQFSQLFWQVTRIRNIYYRHVTFQPLTPGLQWFIRFYNRGKPGKYLMNPKLQLQSAGISSGVLHGLRSLEVRTSPEKTRTEMLDLVKDIWSARKQLMKLISGQLAETNTPINADTCSLPAAMPEIGLVLHFVRTRDDGAMSKGKENAHGLKSNADPGEGEEGKNAGFGRFSFYYKETIQQAKATASVLKHYPLSLQIIRGLDACTDEIGVPLWVIKPLYERVRRAGDIASSSLLKLRNQNVPPLNLTIHAGEDFLHLMSGLRSISEAIDFLELGEDDRIGHGLALGIKPETWAHDASYITMPKETRLLDLIWEWRFYEKQLVQPLHGRAKQLQTELARLSQDIFNRLLSPDQLVQFYECLFNGDGLKHWGWPYKDYGCNVKQDVFMQEGKFNTKDLIRNIIEGKCNEKDLDQFILEEKCNVENPDGFISKNKCNTRELVFQYLYNRECFIKGRGLLTLDPKNEADTLRLIQDVLRNQVASKKITIEVNPSSNLMLGSFATLEEHPFWRFNLPRGDSKSSPVSICLGSDDPLPFATTLRDEFQLLYDSLIIAGMSGEEASRWIDKVRDAGIRSRFTIPVTADEIREDMDAILL